MNKKGILGLDTVKAVILTLLILAVVVVALFAVIIPLRTAVENVDIQTAKIKNETLTSVDENGEFLYAYTLRNPTCTILFIQNKSTGTLILASNYTQTNCNIKSPATFGNPFFNSSDWNVTYSYTYNGNGTNAVVENLLIAPGSFFSNVPTFFVLLGVVVLILIISIIIVAVSRFSGVGAIGESSGESRSGLENI